jgi:NodT family efflux transporter outer membrane factor (OMF) lipoprotein
MPKTVITLDQAYRASDVAQGDQIVGVVAKPCLSTWVAGLAALLLGGCTVVGPDFDTPEPPQSDAWVEADDPKVRSDTEDYSTWWTVLNDPVLNQLVDLAYDDNLSLRIAGLRILEARALLGIAVGEQYPQVQDATGGYNRDKIAKNAPNAASIDRNYDNLSVGLDASWEVDFWGRFRRGIESADASLGATIAEYDDFLVTLTAEVATTYVLIREFEERLALARENVSVQQRTLEIADIRFRAGAVTELDVAQAQALLTDTQALVPFLETLLRQAQNALSVLLGRPPSELREILGDPGTIPQAPAQVAVGIPAELLRRRPDIRNAELEAAAQSARIGIAKADLYPRFTLAGFVGFNTSDAGGRQSNDASLSDIVDSDSFTGFIGPSFRWPILNYGRLTNNVRVQDARFQELAVAYQNTVLRAYQEVEDSLVAFLRAQDQTRFLTDSVTASQRSVELSLIQYREGIADYVRVLDAQRFLVNQQDRQAESRGTIARSLIGTFKALGGGWETRDPNASVPLEVQDEMQARTNWGDVLPATGLEEVPSSGEEVRATPTMFRPPDW